MNSLSISGEEQVGDPTSAWGMSESWDPPVATAICTAALADSRHYHGGHGQLGSIRQDWEWPAPETGHSIILPPGHYSTDDQEEIDCKPAIMQVEALGGGAVTAAGHLTSRHYNGILATSLPSSIAAAQAAASTWPNMFNAAAAIRHHNGSNIGLDISSPHATYVASSYGNLGPSSSNHAAAAAPGSYGGSSSLSNYFGMSDPCARLALVAEQHRPNLLDLGGGNDEHRRIHDILRRSLYSSTSATDFNARIGLNLGGRTYFSTEDVMNSTLMAARFGRRFRPNSPGAHVPLCQAEGCKADLGTAKHYHRRHKVCEQHSKAATVLINGQTQRFCQQCSRFHALSEFDEGKRSCRKRLADHNRRRRKPQPTPPTASSPGSHAASGSASTPASSAADNGRNGDGSKAEKANSNEEAAKNGSVQPNKDQVTIQKQDAGASSSQKSSSLLSAISLVPSVSLTLQNDNRENVHSKSSEDTDQKEAGAASGSYQPSYLLNGPSLTLSSLAESQAQSSAQNTNFAEVDLPWLTAARALDNSSRMDLIDSVGRSASTMAATANDHQHAAFDNDTKTTDWNVTPNLPDNGTDGRTVLSLLEGSTAARGASNHNNRLIEHEMITQNQLTNRAPSSSSNSLGFLQDHLHPCPNSRTTHHVQSQDDHVLSMQQRMSNMYTTADFMKDSFL